MGQGRGDTGADGRIGDPAMERVKDDLVDIARLGGEVTPQQILRSLRLRSLQRELVGLAGTHRAGHAEDEDEQRDPCNQCTPPVLHAPARHARDDAALSGHSIGRDFASGSHGLAVERRHMSAR
jgi:hypothetical protein